MNFLLLFSIGIALIIGWFFNPQKKLPVNDINISYPYKTIENFLTDEQHKIMMKLIEDLETYPTSIHDWTSKHHSHIGEAIDPIINNNTILCPSAVLVYHPNLKKCIFANRIDIGKHYLYTGGYNGWKENYHKSVARMSSFNKFQFNALERKEFIDLFNNENFLANIKDICPINKSYLKPFQLSFIIQIPGQSVPFHLDVPYFFGASRHSFPQWLLIVMEESKLFDEYRIPQIQALAYVHDWGKNDADKHGEFIIYPNGIDNKEILIPAKPKSGIIIDGSRLVHGTSTFEPNLEPLLLSKDKQYHIYYNKTESLWNLKLDNTTYKYKWNNIRASIVYRGWCFENKSIADNYDPYEYSDDNSLSLNNVINKLKNNLIDHNVITEYEWNQLSKYDIGLLLIDNYIRLPKSPLTWIPLNYCMIFSPSSPLFNYKWIMSLEKYIC